MASTDLGNAATSGPQSALGWLSWCDVDQVAFVVS
jgi:hypothetical protein